MHFQIFKNLKNNLEHLKIISKKLETNMLKSIVNKVYKGISICFVLEQLVSVL